MAQNPKAQSSGTGDDRGMYAVGSDEAVLLEVLQVARRALRGLVDNGADIDEIAQETALVIIRRIADNRGVLADVEGLLNVAAAAARRMAVNEIRDRRVARIRETTLGARIDATRRNWMNPDETVIERDMRAATQATIDGLKPEARRIFRLAREEGLKPSEIDASRARSISTELGRINKQLRAALSAWEPGKEK